MTYQRKSLPIKVHIVGSKNAPEWLKKVALFAEPPKGYYIVLDGTTLSVLSPEEFNKYYEEV